MRIAGTILGFILLGGLAWLYSEWGWWAVAIAVVVIAGGVWELAKEEEAKEKDRRQFERVPSDGWFIKQGWIVDSWFNHDILLNAISDDVDPGSARHNLQKISYSMVKSSVPADQKVWFKEFMKDFAAIDPLYSQTILRLKEILADKPGLIQSEIYKGRSDKEKEGARYILYFADELGDIHRVKSGRSYKLFLPGQMPVPVA